MPFGAAESMFVHEILGDKICMLDHFAMYAEQCQDPMLKQMIMRHMQTALQSYNQLVMYTHDYQQAQLNMMNPMNITPSSVQYGLHNPPPSSPQMQGGRFNDQQIAGAVLGSHKNSAKNQMAGAVECADPNVRQMLMNGSVACCNQAYETFMYMNQRGWYQVPTLNDHTAKTFLHQYQQAGVAGQPATMKQQSPMMAANQGYPRAEYNGNPFLM